MTDYASIWFIYRLSVPERDEKRFHHMKVCDVLEAWSDMERFLEESDAMPSHRDIFRLRREILKAVSGDVDWIHPNAMLFSEKSRAILRNIVMTIGDPTMEAVGRPNVGSVYGLIRAAEGFLPFEEDSAEFDSCLREMRIHVSRLHDALPELSDTPESHRMEKELALTAYSIRRFAAICRNEDNILAVHDLLIELRSLGI